MVNIETLVNLEEHVAQKLKWIMLERRQKLTINPSKSLPALYGKMPGGSFTFCPFWARDPFAAISLAKDNNLAISFHKEFVSTDKTYDICIPRAVLYKDYQWEQALCISICEAFLKLV